MKYRKKPVVIEAFRVPADGPHGERDPLLWGRIVGWFAGHSFDGFYIADGLKIEIKTLEGTMTAEPGDWIIRGIKGEFYPCKPDIFAATYEQIDGTPVR